MWRNIQRYYKEKLWYKIFKLFVVLWNKLSMEHEIWGKMKYLMAHLQSLMHTQPNENDSNITSMHIQKRKKEKKCTFSKLIHFHDASALVLSRYGWLLQDLGHLFNESPELLQPTDNQLGWSRSHKARRLGEGVRVQVKGFIGLYFYSSYLRGISGYKASLS